MGVKATYAYDYPAKDRQEVYGDDMLVHVLWSGNTFLCAAACARLPKAMPWSAFVSEVVAPWAAADPDYDPAAVHSWQVDGQPVSPGPDTTLESAGVVHKGVVSFHV